MSIQASEKARCEVADAASGSPVYQTLGHLMVARFSGEQTLLRTQHLTDGAFAQYVLSGERMVEIGLEGLSDGLAGEQLLLHGFLHGQVRLIRLRTAQGTRLDGRFHVTRFQQEAAGERFERIHVDLRSEGAVTLV